MKRARRMPILLVTLYDNQRDIINPNYKRLKDNFVVKHCGICVFPLLYYFINIIFDTNSTLSKGVWNGSFYQFFK